MLPNCWNCLTRVGLLGTAIVCAEIASKPAIAQIIPDNSLGSERSIVTPNGLQSDRIDGGAIRGVNLFHSFLEFNVKPNRGAYFFSPNAAIDNILVRVTGNNPSKIFGILGTRGDASANLFLLNPNGILFGQNASLEIGGSFVATTANEIEFGDKGSFSATNPTSPGLLTINPSALLFNQMATQGIRNEAILAVPNGESLLLAGGDIKLNGGYLLAPSGNIGLASLSSSGRVDLSLSDNQLRFGLLSGARGDISVDGTFVLLVNTGKDPAGDIAIDSRRLFVTNGAQIGTGTFGSGKGGDITIDTGELFVNNGATIATITSGSGQGGNLEVTADLVKVSGTSANGESATSLFTQTSSQDAGGDGGDLTIDTRGGRLLVTDGARISTSTSGSGKGGDLQVNADSVEIGGTSANGKFQSRLFTSPNKFSTGEGGDLTIDTRQLFVTEGAQVFASTFGSGDGGDLRVTATDRIVISGTGTLNDGTVIASSLSTQAEQDSIGEGKAGDLTIKTGQLFVINGAQIGTGTFSSKNGGNLQITATDRIVINGTSADGKTRSGLFTQVESSSTGEGKAGDLTIKTGQLFVTDGAFISASTLSSKDAGDVTITTGQLFVTNGAQISTSTFGSEDPAKRSGNGGNLRVNADRIEVRGTSADGQVVSSLSTDTAGLAKNAGSLTISTGQLFVTNGAQISASTFGSGNGGNLQVKADRIEVRGTSADGETRSGLFANADLLSTGEGTAGNLTINTRELLVTDEAQISASTSSSKDAGNLTIKTGQLFVNNGAQISSATFGSGNGGNLRVNGDRIELRGISADGEIRSGLFTNADSRSTGEGTAGNLTIDSRQLFVSDGAVISASTASSKDAGNLTITAGQLLVTNGSQISSDTSGSGDSGSLEVRADRIEIRGISGRIPSGLFAGTHRDSTGNAGNLTITAGQLFVTDRAEVRADTLGSGDGGDLTINAKQVFLNNVGGIGADTFYGSGDAGNLTINTGELLITNGSLVSASTFLGSGDAGDLTINTGKLLVADGSLVLAGSFESKDGNGGNLQVTADTVELRGGDRSLNGLFTSAGLGSTGNAGDLTVTTRELFISDNSAISSASFGTGNAGNIRLQADSAKLDNGTIAAFTRSGEGGNITFNVSDLLLLDNNSLISTTAGGTGNGGNMAIDTRFLVAVDDSDITANAFEGNGGNIDITAQGIFRSADSDITASSQLGISGSVRLNTPDIDPSRGLVNLPSDVVDASGQIAQTCYRPVSSGSPSQFIITGRGGLPATLGETTSQEQSLVGLVSPVPASNSATESTAPTRNINADAPLPIEAQGWVVDANGEVYLVAQMPNGSPVGSQLPAKTCDRVAATQENRR